MKYRYIQPAAKVVNINVNAILAGSVYIPNQEEVPGNKALSNRDMDLENDEEEEYY